MRSSPNSTRKGHSDDHHHRGTIPPPRDTVTRITPALDEGPAPERPPHREMVRASSPPTPRASDSPTSCASTAARSSCSTSIRVTTQLLALRRELPDAQIHFATKSLPHPAVIRASTRSARASRSPRAARWTCSSARASPSTAACTPIP
jgi:hypothetical protein